MHSEPSSRINKSTRTRTTSTGSGVSKPTVNRELNFDSPSLVSSVMHESRSRQRSRSPNFQRHLESQIVRDIGYDSEPILDSTPNSTIRRSYNYSKTNKQTVPSYNTDIIEVETSALPAELKDVPLSNDLLPGPGTKVTTTVSIHLVPANPIDVENVNKEIRSISRLKLLLTKYPTIQMCQLTKISYTKMNSTTR